MPRHQLLLFCLVSSQLAVTAVMAARQLSAVGGGAVLADAPFAGGDSDAAWSTTTDRRRARSLLEPGSLAGSPLPLGLSQPHHEARRPFDKTFTGGKIILVGLAAAIVVSVFCYIRITRAKKNTDPKT